MLKCPLSPHSKQANDCAFLTLGATSLERFIPRHCSIPTPASFTTPRIELPGFKSSDRNWLEFSSETDQEKFRCSRARCHSDDLDRRTAPAVCCTAFGRAVDWRMAAEGA